MPGLLTCSTFPSLREFLVNLNTEHTHHLPPHSKQIQLNHGHTRPTSSTNKVSGTISLHTLDPVTDTNTWFCRVLSINISFFNVSDCVNQMFLVAYIQGSISWVQQRVSKWCSFMLELFRVHNHHSFQGFAVNGKFTQKNSTWLFQTRQSIIPCYNVWQQFISEAKCLKKYVVPTSVGRLAHTLWSIILFSISHIKNGDLFLPQILSMHEYSWLITWNTISCCKVVSYPSRWSFSFTLGPLYFTIQATEKYSAAVLAARLKGMSWRFSDNV